MAQTREISEEFYRLIEKLNTEGGQIVPTSELSTTQIAIARGQDRMAVDTNGLGYVWFPTARIKGQDE